VALDVAGGEPLHRARTGVVGVTDGGGQRDELFELAGLGPRRVFGTALDEDPLTGNRVDGDDPVAIIESFWARVQVELLNRRRWRTRLELATALFEYLEIFHNWRRRHSALGAHTHRV
jgi:Integrase core domain